MGTAHQTYECPHCNTTMSEDHGPNWTRVPANVRGGAVAVISCVNCHKSLGPVFVAVSADAGEEMHAVEGSKSPFPSTSAFWYQPPGAGPVGLGALNHLGSA